jgi:hypothetical protein
MRYIENYNHEKGEDCIKEKGVYEWVTDIFQAPEVTIAKGCTTIVRNHVRSKVIERGWSDEIKVDPLFDVTVFSIGNNIGFQIQTGNITRAFYDLLKLEYLYKRGKIECSVLAVPSLSASKKIGQNIANFTRIMNELSLFKTVITHPLTLISFE